MPLVKVSGTYDLYYGNYFNYLGLIVSVSYSALYVCNFHGAVLGSGSFRFLVLCWLAVEEDSR